jgi:hypothetical protein
MNPKPTRELTPELIEEVRAGMKNRTLFPPATPPPPAPDPDEWISRLPERVANRARELKARAIICTDCQKLRHDFLYILESFFDFFDQERGEPPSTPLSPVTEIPPSK